MAKRLWKLGVNQLLLFMNTYLYLCIPASTLLISVVALYFTKLSNQIKLLASNIERGGGGGGGGKLNIAVL
jgi:hypothetical protein